jgi:hypothetical protein
MSSSRDLNSDAPDIDKQDTVELNMDNQNTDEQSAANFTTVAQLLSPTDAYLLAGCLQAAGIAAVVADANLIQANYLLAIAVGGVRILVPTAHATEATAVIAAFHRGDYSLADDDESYRE